MPLLRDGGVAQAPVLVQRRVLHPSAGALFGHGRHHALRAGIGHGVGGGGPIGGAVGYRGVPRSPLMPPPPYERGDLGNQGAEILADMVGASAMLNDTAWRFSSRDVAATAAIPVASQTADTAQHSPTASVDEPLMAAMSLTGSEEEVSLQNPLQILPQAAMPQAPPSTVGALPPLGPRLVALAEELEGEL